jgi:hypothetical protein
MGSGSVAGPGGRANTQCRVFGDGAKHRRWMADNRRTGTIRLISNAPSRVQHETTVALGSSTNTVEMKSPGLRANFSSPRFAIPRANLYAVLRIFGDFIIAAA